MTIEDVLDKHFKEERTKYFLGSDALRLIEGETWLSFNYRGDICELYFNSDNGGEICIMATRIPEKLDSLILAII